MYYRIVEKNSKHKKKAVVASMRRLGVLMWHLAWDAQMKAVVFNDGKNKGAYVQTI